MNRKFKTRKFYPFPLKKVIIVLIVTISFPFIRTFAINQFTNFLYDRDFVMNSANFEIDIDESGNMHVKETVINRYKNDHTVFFKEINYNKNNQLSHNLDNANIEDLSLKVYDEKDTLIFNSLTYDNTHKHFIAYKGDYDERGNIIRCSNIPYCDTVFYYREEGIPKTTKFVYEYTITGAITQYEDVSELNWVFLEDQSFKIKNISIKVNFPNYGYDMKTYPYYLYGFNKGKFDLTNNTLNISIKRLDFENFIEARILLPNEMFSSINPNNISNLSRYNSIKDTADELLNLSNTYIKFGNKLAAYSLVILGLTALWYSLTFRRALKHKGVLFDAKYHREMPGNLPPAIVGVLYNFEEVDNNHFSATLMDLIRRKYLYIDYDQANLNNKKLDFTIVLNKEKDLNELYSFEQQLIIFFINDLGDGDKVHSKQLKPSNANAIAVNKFQRFYNTFANSVRAEASKYNFFDTKILSKRSWFSLFTIFSFLTTLTLLFARFLGYPIMVHLFYLSLGISISLIMINKRMSKRTLEAENHYLRWKGFKNFLTDFSHFEDYPIPSLIIWEHYLVYATAFGIADKVMDQLKLEFKDLNVDAEPLTFLFLFFMSDFRIYMVFRIFNTFRYLNTLKYIINIAKIPLSIGVSFGSSSGGGGGKYGGR